MKVVQNKLIPFKGFVAIMLFGFLFTRNKFKIDKVTYNHESIHEKQMYELLIIPFYIWYIIEFLIRFVRYLNFYKAYRNICFEREAFGKERDFNYLSDRKHYSFLKYL